MSGTPLVPKDASSRNQTEKPKAKQREKALTTTLRRKRVYTLLSMTVSEQAVDVFTFVHGQRWR